MPDEILEAMENEIIRRYTERLREIIMADTRMRAEDVDYVKSSIDKAMITYDRLYK